MHGTNCICFEFFKVVSDLNTRAYKDPNDNLGPCDVCKLSLSLDPANAEVMTSTGWYFLLTQTVHPKTGIFFCGWKLFTL